MSKADAVKYIQRWAEDGLPEYDPDSETVTYPEGQAHLSPQDYAALHHADPDALRGYMLARIVTNIWFQVEELMRIVDPNLKSMTKAFTIPLVEAPIAALLVTLSAEDGFDKEWLKLEWCK